TKTAYIPALGVNRTSPASFPANIAQTDFATGHVYGFPDLRNPTIPFPAGPASTSCAPPYSFAPRFGNEFAPFVCGFDYASVIDTLPEAEKANVLGRFAWQVDADSQIFSEVSYYRGTFNQRVSPTPVASFAASTPMTLSPASPYYPAEFVAS